MLANRTAATAPGKSIECLPCLRMLTGKLYYPLPAMLLDAIVKSRIGEVFLPCLGRAYVVRESAEAVTGILKAIDGGR